MTSSKCNYPPMSPLAIPSHWRLGLPHTNSGETHSVYSIKCEHPNRECLKMICTVCENQSFHTTNQCSDSDSKGRLGL